MIETEIVYQEKLDRFFQPLIQDYKVLKLVKKQTDRYLASDFNLIDIMNPNENKISDILKLLLEKDGKHGQGNKFLELFLKKIIDECSGPDEFIKNIKDLYKSEKVSISRESPANNFRRIDILIDFSGKFAIAIENKLRATEQDSQLEHYSEFLNKEYNKNHILVYLDGSGRESITLLEKESKIKDGNFIETSYQDFLIPWLEECKKESESDKIRWFLMDFISWIDDNFKEEEINNEQ